MDKLNKEIEETYMRLVADKDEGEQASKILVNIIETKFCIVYNRWDDQKVLRLHIHPRQLSSTYSQPKKRRRVRTNPAWPSSCSESHQAEAEVLRAASDVQQIHQRAN